MIRNILQVGRLLLRNFSRMGAFSLAVAFFALTISAVFPLSASAEIVEQNSGHYKMSGEWIDRHQIKITSFELIGNEYVSLELSNEMKGDLAKVNQKIKDALGDGIFTSPNISPDSSERGKFYKDACGGNKIVFTISDISEGNPTSNRFVVSGNDFYITDAGNAACVPVIANEGAGIIESRELTVDISNESNRNIWFKAVSSESLDRVDGIENGFKKFGDNPKLYIQKEGDGDCQVRVEFPSEPKPPGAFEGFYETCDLTGGGADGLSFSIVNNVKTVFGGGLPETAPNGPGGSVSTEKPNCESTGGLTYFICPMINGLAEVADGAFNLFIKPMLTTPPVDIANTSSPIFKVWVAVRNIANILLIVAMIVIVFGQAIGGGLVDAYTAKKVLPRILAAAIMINLSIYMVAFAVDMTNIIGGGLSRLIYSPFDSTLTFKFNISNPTAGAAGLGMVGLIGGAIWAGTALIPWILLFVLLPLALAMLGVMFTLVLRQGLIQFLIISSPVACVLYCLPNTEKYFKKWWSLFLKTLMVYPIIVLIFALADILAVTTNLAASNDPGASQLPSEIIAIVLMVLPLFMVPYAFKLAGGAIGAVHGAVLDRGKKGVEAVKGNVNDPNSLRNRTKRRTGEKITLAQSRLVDAGRDPSAKGRRKLVGNIADRFGNVDGRMSEYMLKSKNASDALSSTGRDDLLYAGAGWKEGKLYKDSKGRTISKNQYKRGKQLYGGSNTAIAQSLEYTLRKAQTDEDFANYRTAIARNAQQNDWNQSELSGVHAAATYPHKTGMAASEWYSAPKIDSRTGEVTFNDISNDAATYGKFIGDLSNTRLGYQLPARDQDYRAMLGRQTFLEDKLDAHRASGAVGPGLTAEEATQLTQTYQVFDQASHQYSMGAGTLPGATGAAGASVSATAGTATAQPYIEKAINQRAAKGYSLSAPIDGPGPAVAGGGGFRDIVHTSGSRTSARIGGDVGRSDIPRSV